jgi:hypothetical protein
MPLFAYLSLGQDFDFSKHPNTVSLQKECQESIPESKSVNSKMFANFASKILP